MKQTMQAIVLSEGKLALQEVPRPTTAAAGHLLVEMIASAINPGDKFFLTRPTLPGAVSSLYDIRGVSGVGRVVDVGAGVPAVYAGAYVTMYRQLAFSTEIVGMWSGYAHVPFLDAAILPAGVEPTAYSGSMVNIITPYAFLEQVREEGHAGIIATAGNSATGKAMLGICKYKKFPLLSIVRDEEGRKELEALGAEHIVAQTDPNFPEVFAAMATALNCTAVFDGVGGAILNKIILQLPQNSVIYSYGYLGDSTPLTVHLSALVMKNLRIQFFSNFGTATVRNIDRLAAALTEIGRMIDQPHFVTPLGQRFGLNEIDAAIAYQPGDGKKAVLVLGADA